MNVRKFRNYDEEKVLLREKMVFLFQILSYKNRKAQNMPEVAGSLVFYQLDWITLAKKFASW